jgi:transcriptional regulator with XRE-family HTH domain
VEPLHLPIQLGRLLDQQGISQRELARRCEISPSTITKIMESQRCSPEVMTLLCEKLATTVAEVYGLYCAHLHDELVRCKGDPAHVVIRHVDGVDLKQLDLTPEMNAYIGIVARGAESDDNVAKVVEAISGMLTQRAALEADLQAKVTPFPAALGMVAEESAPYGEPVDQVLAAERERRNQDKRAVSKSSSSSSSSSKA